MTTLPPLIITFDGYTYSRVAPVNAASAAGSNTPDFYRNKGNANPLAQRAIANAAGDVGTTNMTRKNHCLAWVREQYGLSSKYSSAAADWHAVPDAQRHGWYAPPAGVPVFWTGGSSGDGHVAISDGKGHVFSTDIGGAGTVTLVPIDKIRSEWGLVYAGWAETLEDVRVYG